MSLTLIGIPAAINQSLEILKKLRDSKKISSDNLDKFEKLAADTDALIKAVSIEMDLLTRWKFVHNLSQIVMFAERKQEFELVETTHEDNFVKIVPRDDEVFRRLAADHRKVSAPRGSLRLLSAPNPSNKNVPSLVDAGLLKESETWTEKYREFLKIADEFYGDGSSIPGQRECEKYRDLAREFHMFMIGMNTLADQQIMNGIDRLEKLCVSS